jgi:uncharacterized repeat protein (TIGR02543 family)
MLLEVEMKRIILLLLTLAMAVLTLAVNCEPLVFTVVYNGNGNTGGSVPVDSNPYLEGETVTVMEFGTLARTGYSPVGWNTEAGGSGTAYAPSATFVMGTSDVTLYAQWTPLPTYTVAYNGNGNTGGTVPIDSNDYLEGAIVTVMEIGTLVRTGYGCLEWNTAANGSGTAYAPGATFVMGASDVTLYAQWTQDQEIVGEWYVAGSFDFYDEYPNTIQLSLINTMTFVNDGTFTMVGSAGGTSQEGSGTYEYDPDGETLETVFTTWVWGGEAGEPPVVPQLGCVIDGDTMTYVYPEVSGQWAEPITYTRQ